MSRSKWKGPFSQILKKKKILYVWSRDSIIPAFLIGCFVYIHFGIGFKKVLITREKVGLKFGLFAKTRKKTKTKIKNKKYSYGTKI